ncbi:hypothetical protein SLINC_1163 [Streptomyces lincolnensis]|uniref:Uncharacterized protein n=1 Tax=Streptomyces lincolnensis TaxID=1915 RepID=A0A1B1M4M4_STRLN|nr:hypothetical protein [Streptomyces lincolnensis]ANS63387.1 hypothetical protein SLINC_1163 [Streptomyces lincolnensis]AXG52309.1 hypothetical protein SLCG_1154 [Streptomyces lincolnensis]QMV05281.1 hypothetical protein GJU35_06180 [Streptomyces lincolnensis]
MKHRLLGAAVAGCALAALGAGPVHALSDELWISVPSETVLPGPDADGSTRERTLEVRVTHDNVDNDVPAGRLTVDASEIASFAHVSWPANCTPESGLKAVCAFPAMPVGTEGVPAALIGLRALSDADLSASGSIRYTAAAGELSAADAETRITVGDGPDLGLSQAPWQRGLTPGTNHTVRATVANNGNRAVERTLLWVSASYGLRFKDRHANCEYQDHATGTGALCVLDEAVAPGQRYDLVTRLGIGRKALYERFDHSVLPYSDAALEEARGDGTWTRGTGPELDLRAVAGQRAAADGDDVDLNDNYRTVILDAKNTADLKLTGNRMRGAAGDTVTARMTVLNRGPAWVASLGAGSAVASVRFQAPAGTSVVGLPEDCWTQPPSEEGPSEATYFCWTPIYLHDKASYTFDVQLRIDKVVRGARAVIETVNDGELPITKFDPNLRNNVSAIVVNG